MAREQRALRRQWRNGRGGQWTRRARYFEGIHSSRVNVEDHDKFKCSKDLIFRGDGHQERAVAAMELFASDENQHPWHIKDDLTTEEDN